MELEAERVKIKINFIEAVDGRELDIKSVKEYNRQARLRHASDLTTNEIGCVLSHKKALEHFLASDHAYAVIFEDDAVLADHFLDYVNAVTNLPVSWQTIALHNRRKKIIGPSLMDPVGGSGLYATAWLSNGAEAWLFSRRGAEHALKSLQKFRHSYDTHMGFFWRHALSPMCAYPAVVTLLDTPSTMHDHESGLVCWRKGLTRMQFVRSRLERIHHEIRKETQARIFKFTMRTKLALAAQKNDRLGLSEPDYKA